MLEEIIQRDDPEIERLKAAFEHVTDSILETGARELELARALGNEQDVVKTHVKIETIRHARSILEHCYALIERSRTHGS
jgi:hypothetical protein